jgi:lysophospholipase L1-like esterase
MRIRLPVILAAALLAATGFAPSAGRAASNGILPELVPAGVKRVLFLGDSITYQGSYVVFTETYFRTRHPERSVQFINAGLGSETVSGLSEPEHVTRNGFARPDLHERLGRVLAQSKPDLIIACYGMNDGIYLPLEAERLQKYEEGIAWLRAEAAKAGAKILLVTPPVFDEVKGGHAGYGATLDHYAEWLVSRRTEGWDVADLHTPMKVCLAEHRAKDAGFAFARDGVHPDDLGHWVMARAILSHLGAKDVAEMEDPKAVVSAIPHGEELLGLVRQRQNLLRDAWLTATGHKRPGVKKGLPLDQAEAKAAELEVRIKKILSSGRARE